MVDLNCDMGEGFGIYSFADDEEIMPFIDAAMQLAVFTRLIQIP